MSYRTIAEREPIAKVFVKPMHLSDGRTDYFVAIRVRDREVTPHVFREEYKAAYHVALYDWLLNGGNGDGEPDVMEFKPEDWPALRTQTAPDTIGLLQSRYALRSLDKERPGCGYGKMADWCGVAAVALWKDQP